MPRINEINSGRNLTPKIIHLLYSIALPPQDCQLKHGRHQHLQRPSIPDPRFE